MAKINALKKLSVRECLEQGIIKLNEVGHAEKAKVHLTEPYEHDSVRGIWLWGAPAAGKSYSALKSYGTSVYRKSNDQWWQGYSGEKVVVLDDIRYEEKWDEQERLAERIAAWTDVYEAQGQVKGSSVHLHHHLFVITANYSMDVMFGQLRQKFPDRFVALTRRMLEIKEFKQSDVVPWEEIKVRYPLATHDCMCKKCTRERSSPAAPQPIQLDDDLFIPQSPVPNSPEYLDADYSQPDYSQPFSLYMSQPNSIWSQLPATQPIDLTQDDE